MQSREPRARALLAEDTLGLVDPENAGRHAADAVAAVARGMTLLLRPKKVYERSLACFSGRGRR